MCVELLLVAAIASPKSVILDTPCTSTRMFWGETSRWMTPLYLCCGSTCSCAACSPDSVSSTMRMAMWCGIGSFDSKLSAMKEQRESPSMYSMTKYGPCSVVPASWTGITWWCRMLARRRASSRSIRMHFGSFARCWWSCFMAKSRWNPRGPVDLAR